MEHMELGIQNRKCVQKSNAAVPFQYKTRFVFTYFLKKQSEAVMEAKQTGCKLKMLRSNNGKEYINSRFEEYFAENGIMHQTTVGYCPLLNDVSERANKTLIEMAWCLLEYSGLSQSLWAKAINTATYIRNRCPTKVLYEVTTFEKWYARKPAIGHLRISGCYAVVLKKRSAKRWNI